MREIERMDMENGSETKIKSNKANIKKNNNNNNFAK